MKVNQKQNFLKGLIKENPVFVFVLGICSTLAVTTSLESGIGMSLAVIFVLFFSNVVISLIKNIIPNDIRIPVFIIVITTFVSVVELIMQAYLPDLYDQLGVFVALIAVNCIILGRAEAFASKNNVLSSAIDALGMGLGYTIAICLASIVREVLGTGLITIWGNAKINLMPIFDFFHVKPSAFFTSNVGAFIVLGIVIGIVNAIVFAVKDKKEKIKKEVKANG
ncbi:MAG TPA: electron transport complex subunit RsxE [Bacilli bacterium]|nr:electron transport complex subunit RsxE [Bacilli bacterium]